ncbi:sialidase family protein [Anatilimnocola floriformis]|uniref:sialidase family protein n=1 Tax=Anatilimnocola floriformis TaxID=2948575 RepID=UPI0020C48EA2|nr:sialidase family protein [Anatilimnocola floriformis]
MIRFLSVMLLCIAVNSFAQEAKLEKGKWTVISDSTLAKVEKIGYPGKTAGVTVDPANGNVFMVVPDNGMWLSTDHGETFARVDDKKIGGRTETGYALNFDPAGKRLMCFMIYGSSALTTDGGKTWTASKTSHLDFGAVDWHATGKVFLSFRHENKDLLTLSTDEGQTWTDLQPGFSHLGVVSDKILLASKKKGILRSTDGGQTWTEVSDITPTARVSIVRDGTIYWASAKGLLTSKDEGKTWEVLAGSPPCVFGPYFGKTATEMMLVNKEGFHESTDGGKNWKPIAPLPDTFTVGPVGPNYAWDPQANILYASSMGKDTLRFVR